MSGIIIEKNVTIPLGNMGFMQDCCPFESLTNQCIYLEKQFRTNYVSFMQEMRKTYEKFVCCVNTQNEDSQAHVKLDSKIKNGEIAGYPSLLSDILWKKFENDFHALIILSEYQNNPSVGNRFSFEKKLIRDLIRDIFEKYSQFHHVTVTVPPDESEVTKHLKLIHDIFCLYFGSDHKFDNTIIPYKDFYPIEYKLYSKLGFELPKSSSKRIFVKDNNNRNEYYLFTVVKKQDYTGTKFKDLVTAERMENERLQTPININMNNSEEIGSGNWMYFYSKLPSFPVSISEKILEKLTKENKKFIAKEIIKCIQSLHMMDPPFYHRNISAESFLLVKIQNTYQPKLFKMDLVKDSYDSTVLVDFYNRKSLPKYKLLFAPELGLGNNTHIDNIDWEKIDIYALGRTLLFIFTGEYETPTEKPDDLTLDQFEVIKLMLSNDPSERPSTGFCIDIFNT